MEENKLIQNCGEILSDFAENTAIDIIESGIDQLFDDGLLKDIPIVGSVYNLVKSITKIIGVFKTKHILVFASAVNNGKVSKEVIRKHFEELEKNSKKKEHEIEVIIESLMRHDKYIKDQILANCYLMYCSPDTQYTWEDFEMLRQITEDLYVYDLLALKDIYNKKEYRDNNYDALAMRRLCNLGLVDYFGGLKVSNNDTFSAESFAARINNVGELYFEDALKGIKIVYDVDGEERIL